MKVKKFVFSFVIFVIIAGVFDMLCFWLVDDYTTSFYISVAFANTSILVFALASLLMLRKGRYIYLSFQDGFIIGGYTIICMILNLCFSLFGMNNIKVNVIVNVVILAVYLILLFVVFANTAAISSQLEHDRRERNDYYVFKDMAEKLLGKGNNIRVNKRLEFLYDKICSCQINRTVDVSDIDNQILTGLIRLQESLENNAGETAAINKIDEVFNFVEERNRRIINALKR